MQSQFNALADALSTRTERQLASLAEIAGSLGTTLMDFRELSTGLKIAVGEFVSKLENNSAPPLLDKVISHVLQRQDGPDPEKRVFWWKNKPCTLTKREWQFAKAAFGHEPIAFADLGEIIWHNDLTSPKTIRSCMDRLNGALDRDRIPVAWAIDGETVVRCDPI